MRTHLNKKTEPVNEAEEPVVKAVARIYVNVKNNPIHAIVNSNTGMSIISLNLFKQLGIKLDPNTNVNVKGLLGLAKGFSDIAKVSI